VRRIYTEVTLVHILYVLVVYVLVSTYITDFSDDSSLSRVP